MQDKKLYRSKKNKAIAGVIAGLGEFFSVDVLFLRIAALLLLVATGFFPMVLLYVLAVIFIPEGPDANQS